MDNSPYARKYDVSVIVICFNQGKTLKLTLESLLQQDFEGSYEVIICDDGSSVELFNFLRDTFNEARIPIRYIWQQDRSIRIVQSYNNGIKLSQGKILLFLDGDMIPPLDLIRKHIELHDGKKLLITGNRLWVYSETVDITDLSISNALSLFEKHAVVREDVNKRQIEWSGSDKPWKACFTCHLSVLWSPEVYLDDTLIGWGVLDWEMACRLYTRHGYIPIYRNDLIAYQYQIPELNFHISKRNRHEEIVHWLRNVTYFVDKYPDLNLEELFEGFEKFQLDPTTNRWSVRKEKPTSYDLKQIVRNVRKWLAENGVYP